ncbi:rho-related GTP-binding protein RhoF isoform X1 [Macaca nemestrina]|nr:PREDICTED: rho-related GTP-binding protein RhoF isoform X1 [Cercocebus atys]XP_015287156.1 rho-related GTP-binding protein RhoF isoform X1 [Macaca fascicularis]XP_021778746.2 rho-related GTP-binding protein RhoF isoform X1 [Papio anubis]XP_024652617.1 rho-related GTP-binding protein RhoF isoform X1 [Macaca nemestrina]
MDAPGAPAPTAAPGPGRKELKIVIVGDGGCGKTSLLMVYSQGSFPEAPLRTNRPPLPQHYAPSVFEKYTASVTVGSKEVTLNLYDTAGQEDYDRLRPLSYQNTHLVLICYDVMNPTSYDNVLIKWFPEVTHFCRGIPMVLIGCKTDLRKDKEQLRKLRAAQLEPITYMQGLSACEQIRAALYLECSAKFRENVEDVFREAAKVALSALKKAQRHKKHRLCLLL